MDENDSTNYRGRVYYKTEKTGDARPFFEPGKVSADATQKIDILTIDYIRASYLCTKCGNRLTVELNRPGDESRTNDPSEFLCCGVDVRDRR